MAVYLARKNTELEAIKAPDKFAELYIVSLSTRTICYKGQFLPAQVLVLLPPGRLLMALWTGVRILRRLAAP